MAGLRIDVADLLTHPGSRRHVALAEQLDGLAGVAARIDAPVSVDVTLERVPEGIVVRGHVRARAAAECSRCLQPLDQSFEVGIHELFESHPLEGETYLLEGRELDLEQLVRDALVLELPLAPRCEEPCGPEVAGDGGPEPDPRWAALSELEL